MAAAAATTTAAVHICVSCARRRNANASASITNGSSKILHSLWALLTLLLTFLASAALVHTAALPFGDLVASHAQFKPLCSAQHEHFIESEGKESSLIIELKPGSYGSQHPSCSRILSAPADFGFIVRLILPKLRSHAQQKQQQQQQTQQEQLQTSSRHAMPGNSMAITDPSKSLLLLEQLNATGGLSTSTSSAAIVGRTCPLNIFSSLDPHTPQWRVDPCQLEDTAPEMEDPVRLFHGRVRIVWEHGQHSLVSKLMVTVLGKGEQCKEKSKHQCLKIGDEPILCISKELACDGIRHCPYSNEYDSDEDYELCYKNRHMNSPLPTPQESDLFEQFALEVFRNLFGNDAPTGPEDLPRHSNKGNATDLEFGNATTTLRKVHTKDMKKISEGTTSTSATSPSSPNAIDEQAHEHGKGDANGNGTEGGASGAGSGFTRRNSTRTGVHSDLSKYGPWGYLMLGMLLCGGALLICGLWASASQHAASNEREAALAAANGAINGEQLNVSSPPNYEELDPPPAYSVLFPNQKAASSNTLSALDNTVTANAQPQPSTTAAAAAAALAAGQAALMTTTSRMTPVVASAGGGGGEQPQQPSTQQ